MSQLDVSSYIKRWLAFSDHGSPCGENLELEPEFDSLQEEVGRDSSIHADRPTDWNAVLSMADELLGKSKDVWLFAYGIVALTHLAGLKSCAEGVSGLVALLEQAWDSAYPRPDRMPRRLAPLKWLNARLSRYAEFTGFVGAPPDAVQVCGKALEALQGLLDAKIPENGLSFHKVLSCIEQPQISGEEPSGSPEKRASDELDPERSPRAGRTSSAPASVIAPADGREGRIPNGALPQVVRTFNDTARQLGDHMLALNMTDERGYMLHRACCWATLMQLPAVDDQKRSQLICPAEPDRITRYTAAIEEKRFSDVLPHIEKTASKAPFWFDGHYMVVRCLEGLNAQSAAICVKHSLAQVLNRFPELVEYKFKDGKAFASAATVTWLDAVVQSTFAGPHSVYSPGVSGSGYDKPGDELLLQQAISVHAEKGFEAGLALFGHVPPGKSRASIRSVLLKARYCLAAGKKNSARNMLLNVYGDLTGWGLLDWEPKISAAVISLLLSSMPKTHKSDREDLLAQLHKYNLAEALKLTREA